MKTCSRCHLTKPEEEFGRDRKGKNGISCWCVSCHKEYAKEYAKTAKGASVRRAAYRKYNASEHGKTKRAAYNSLDYVKEAKKEWSKSEAGKEYRKAQMEAYKENGKRKKILDKYSKSEKFQKTLKKYQRSPKGRESLARGVHKRRSILENVISDLTADQWEEIKAKQGYLCAMCNAKKPLTRDHIIPLSKGGQHTAANIQALCRSCNAKKNDRLLETVVQSGI